MLNSTQPDSEIFNWFENSCHLQGRSIKLIESNGKKYIQKSATHSLTKEFNTMQHFNSDLIGKVKYLKSDKSYIMKFYPGGNIQCDEPIPKTQAKKIFIQMAKAVEVVHSENYVHLDIRLNNFVQTKFGEIKLIDFEHATNENCDRISEPYGSEKYNSPERYFGDYDGFKADIFSLGVVLFRMVFAEYPFAQTCFNSGRFKLFVEDRPRYWKRLEQHLNKIWQDLEVDEDAKELIDWMLEIDPQARPDISQVLKHKYCEI